ncbi:MAG: SLC13 family permease [Pyrinomonadaceae bacterium]
MTFEIGLTLAILIVAIILFITEIVRIDLVALGVLVTLALTGLVTTDQSLAGFSNPAVITVWAMFILSAGLTRTGVAAFISNQMLRFGRGGEGPLIAALMTLTALLSSFMNNIGVAAMFLPITMDIARRAGHRASKLLLPMAYGSLLGGLILLIGTPSNLIVRDALREAGLRPLGMFDFTIGGLVILALSVIYMTFIGRRFLPTRDSIEPLSAAKDADNGRERYALEERLAYLTVADDSPLAGKTLAESRLGHALGLNVLSIKRQSGKRIPAEPASRIEPGDRLLILGRLDRIEEFAARPAITIVDEVQALDALISTNIALAELPVKEGMELTGKTLVDVGFRAKYALNVLGVLRDGELLRADIHNITLIPGDRLLLQGKRETLDGFIGEDGFRIIAAKEVDEFGIGEKTLVATVPEGSALAGHTIAESRLGAAYGLVALGINRDGQDWQMPEADMTLQVADRLIVGGQAQDIEVLRGLSTLEVDRDAEVEREQLEVETLEVVDVMLSPYTSLAGKTLTELRFRETYGLSVLAIWRGERAYRTGLGDMPLSFGDAMLCHGPREKFEIIARDPDFVVLTADVQETPKFEKAPLAAIIMLAVVGSVIVLGLPISIAAIAGCVLMVLTRCLTMEEAYQGIHWKAVFLIAAMLPIGTAMGQTGAAAFLAKFVIDSVGSFGPAAVLAGLMILSIVVTQMMPSAVVAVLMSPIALTTAADMNVSPYPFMMGIAYALAASFLSPVAHPANVLVMSPGGYRFSDYIKHGLPVSIIVVVTSVLLLPILFPF